MSAGIPEPADAPPVAEVGVRTLVRRFPAAVRPVVRAARHAAPRASATVLAAHVVAGVVAVAGLLTTQDVLAALLVPGPIGERVVAALPAVALVVGAFALRAAFDAIAALALARVGPAVRRVAEERLLRAALGVELAAFDDAAYHDRLHRARDRGLMQLELSTATVATLVSALVGLAGAAGTIALLHPLLLPALLLGVVPEAWAVLRTAQVRYASLTMMAPLDRHVRLYTELATSRDAAPEVRACRAAPLVLDRYSVVADVLRDEATRVGVSGARTLAIGRAVAGLAVGATFGTLLLLVHGGLVPLASAGAAVVAIGVARTALGSAVRFANQLSEQGMYVADLETFVAESAARARAGRPRTVVRAPAEIALRDVRFRYPGAPADTLTGVNLTIRAGESIALVGENGSGKTTLAKLICGLYEPTGGRLTWDGTDVRDLDPDSLAERVVMMQQHPVRWPDDARANVRAGRHDCADPGDELLRRAAALGKADEVVNGLPRGWDTLLTRHFRGGHDLSGGQWQRLAVARGLFRDAPLLIWDEPTAPLDPAAEFAVYESLRAVARGRTVVLITHRLGSVRHVDRVHLLHGGVIAERGTHDELLALGGHYATLYDLQRRTYDARWSAELA